MKLLKRIPKDFFIMLLISVVVTLAYGIYLLLLGVPTTKARNEINMGVALLEQQRYSEAKMHFENSNKIWPSKDAQTYLELVEEKL